MVANTKLAEQVRTRPTYCFYGVSGNIECVRQWEPPLRVLLSGHLSVETGVRNFGAALSLLKREARGALESFRFTIVGSGELAGELKEIAETSYDGRLEFRGRISDSEYQELLRISHIGLCLKMPEHAMGQTTFPSKVIEFATWGLLVVSHKVSDVALLFPEDGAFLLDEPTPQALAEVLQNIAERPSYAASRAIRGQMAVRDRLQPRKVATELRTLWQLHGETAGANQNLR
jgi:glycosyltransferase involved in cell wall biosynthesis